MKGPVVILAAHSSHPPMDGASYRSFAIAKEIRRSGAECYYFAKEEFFRMLPSGETERIDAVQSNRGKNWSAFRALVFQSHYLVEKHLPKTWVVKAMHWLEKIQPTMLVITFLWTWSPRWTAGNNIPIYLETHNYDPEWWSNLKRSSGNWLSRKVCDLSRDYALRMLAALPSGIKLIHVSTADRERYLPFRPDLEHIVLANGCDVGFRKSAPDYGAPRKNLYMLGALNLRITLDALKYFADQFWPSLKDIATMHVYGSGAASEVEALCEANGWKLYKSLSDDTLAQELERMHYLVLPFSYSAGSKLKLINACGKGIPAIATSHGARGFDALPPTVLVSEDPAEWVARIRRPEPPTPEELAECSRFAEAFSWSRLVADSGILNH
jgi:hypothetical protein